MKSRTWMWTLLVSSIRRAGHTGSGESRLHTCQRHPSNKRLLPDRSQP